MHGAAGVSGDFPLAEMYAHQRTLRIADGPDEVHEMTIAPRELLRRDPNFRMNPVATPAVDPADADPQAFARPFAGESRFGAS